MFKLRNGHIFRIYDWGRLTVALDAEARGGVYSPRVQIIYRQPAPQPGRPEVIRYRRFGFPMPVPSWATAYRFRRIGGLRVYKFTSRLIYRAFTAPRP